jgi:hypothetical protein
MWQLDATQASITLFSRLWAIVSLEMSHPSSFYLWMAQPMGCFVVSASMLFLVLPILVFVADTLRTGNELTSLNGFSFALCAGTHAYLRYGRSDSMHERNFRLP